MERADAVGKGTGVLQMPVPKHHLISQPPGWEPSPSRPGTKRPNLSRPRQPSLPPPPLPRESWIPPQGCMGHAGNRTSAMPRSPADPSDGRAYALSVGSHAEAGAKTGGTPYRGTFCIVGIGNPVAKWSWMMKDPILALGLDPWRFPRE